MTAEHGAPDPRRDLRWRLALGTAADPLRRLDGDLARQDRALDFLYGREGETGPGSADGSGLLTPTDWVNEVHELFPRSVAERITDDALNRYGLADIVTNPDVLDRVEPSIGLMKALLNTKHLMDPAVLAKARTIIDTVVRQMLEAMAQPVRQPFTGSRDPRRRSRIRVAANFDAKATVRANLKNVDPATGRLVLSEPIFSTRVRRQQDRWQVIVCLDQSGSMIDSVIHGAVTASIFHGIGSLKTHLIVFDTEVADLSAAVGDPVEVLMSVQLGGGTDIERALRYCRTLVENPRRTIVVLISDFMEGHNPAGMYATVDALVGSGVTVLCLGALSSGGQTVYDRHAADLLAGRGAHVAVMTPDRLAEWVAGVVG